MDRRRLISTSVRSLFGVLAVSSAFPSHAAPEPTYTVTLPGNQILSLRMESVRSPEGRRKIRVWNQPKSVAKSDLYIDTSMVLEADGKASSSRAFIGLNPDQGMTLEAVRSSSGFAVREPALSGDLKFGAPLFVPLIAELFIGKMYDFKRGGPQEFAYLLDTVVTTARIDSLTLTAEGDWETIDLPDGPTKARKLRYFLNEPLLPEPARSGHFYVGQRGEVLKCDTSFFGVPLRAKGPAVWEEQGRRFTLRFRNPDSANRVAVLQADKQAAGDWKVRLGTEDDTKALATLSCDKNYRLKRMETPWHGRPFTAIATSTDTVHWSLAGGPESRTPVPAESAVWFLPHWFATDTWEGAGTAFTGMAIDETRDGFLLPVFFGQREVNPFTLERRAEIQTSKTPLRHYRFYNGGKHNSPVTLLPGGPPAASPSTARFDLYTDGSRLAVFLSSDGIRIVRSGWEKFAAALTPPTTQAEMPPPPPADSP